MVPSAHVVRRVTVVESRGHGKIDCFVAEVAAAAVEGSGRCAPDSRTGHKGGKQSFLHFVHGCETVLVNVSINGKYIPDIEPVSLMAKG